MALTKWNPFFADLAATEDRFKRLFGREDFWNTEGVTTGGEWAPVVDIIENDKALTVKAELPGIEAKDVAVTIDNNVLTLKGERHIKKEVEKENYHRMERAYGTFARSFVLPAFVDADNIKAEFKNGLLMVTVPKKANARTRAVEVTAA
jgi:HSP20 family protein